MSTIPEHPDGWAPVGAGVPEDPFQLCDFLFPRSWHKREAWMLCGERLVTATTHGAVFWRPHRPIPRLPVQQRHGRQSNFLGRVLVPFRTSPERRLEAVRQALDRAETGHGGWPDTPEARRIRALVEGGGDDR